jgi:hypothetical protein
MQSVGHKAHIAQHISHNNCPECRADNERQFVRLVPWREYQLVGDYLSYVKPRLQACAVDSSTDAKVWYRQFRKALHIRISLRVPIAGRKQCDSYLERIAQFRNRGTGAWGCHDASYLRQFTQRGASCLDQ